MFDEFRRLALFTSGVAELTRHRAEQIVRDMVKSGEVRRDQAGGLVKTLLDLGNVNRGEFIETMRGEIRNQIVALGLATQRDVERLERRVSRLEDKLREAKAATDKKTTVRKKSTAKSTRKKTATGARPATGAAGSRSGKTTVDRAPVPPHERGDGPGA